MFWYDFRNDGTQHNSATAILRLCAHVVHGQARAQTFNIVYSMLHLISFRMSGRSSLCDVWFSQTLRHKFDLYIYLSTYISVYYTKNQKVWLCG